MSLSKSTFLNGTGTDNLTIQVDARPRVPKLMGYTDTIFLFEVIVRIGITGVLAMYGIVANVVNVIVFYRQGVFSDSCNASLLVLAVSDFICCILTFWASVCILILNTADTDQFRWDVFDFCLGSALRPKRLFTQITVWITAYVAFERCFSVVFPFKAKYIFSAKRSFVINCVIFGSIFALCFPQYAEHFPTWKQVPGRNFSRLVFVYNDKITRPVYQTFEILNAFALRISGILLVFICNLTLIWKVNLSKKFKQLATATTSKAKEDEERNASAPGKEQATNAAKYAQKEKKLMRMVTVLCSITLICYSPDMFILIVNQLIVTIPVHIYLILIAPLEVMETFNSCINIHVYYNMSTRYRNEFRKWIWGKEK